MKKKFIILTICILIIFLIGIGIGTYFYFKHENKKYTIANILTQCKAQEDTYNEMDDSRSDNDEYTESYEATKYICYNKDFNQIVQFKKDEKSSEETYAFRVETGEQIGNGGLNFNYEIGRIVIDTVNLDSSKCTYNYRGHADWKPCKEKTFIKSLPEISLLKAQAYEPLKPLIKELNERSVKAEITYSEYNAEKAEEAYDKYVKQLKILRNVSLDN